MSQELDSHPAVVKYQRQVHAATKALEGGLERAIANSGYQFTGLAFKLRGSDCLMTLKAISGEGPHVAFVGSDSLVGCLGKAVRELDAGRVRWREDRYVG
jgi:hypothetical protein